MVKKKSEATQKLEGLITEFQTELIPALIEFSHSNDLQNSVSDLQGKNYEDIWLATEQFRRPFKEPNCFGIKYANNQFYAVLIEEEDLDDSGLFDRVYMSILEEVKENLPVSGRTFFYPAIGHDWRLADVWSKSQIIGIDPDRTLRWTRPNVVLLTQEAQDFDEVKRNLQERGLSSPGNVILKGASFTFGPVIEKPQKIPQYSQTPHPTFSTDYDMERFHQLIKFYHAPQDLLIALSREDVNLCGRYLRKYKRVTTISPQFRRALRQWQQLEAKYTKQQMLGFWRSTIEPYAYRQG